MHQYRGKLIVHTGSMFSGKTSSLERDIKRFKIARYKSLVFKPIMDNRYSETEIVTHDNTSLSALAVESIEDIRSELRTRDVDVVGIDEIQFLKGEAGFIREFIEELLLREKTVIVAGLDMDFTGQAFEIVKELMPMADYVYKHHAVCVSCGSDAWISHRISEKEDRILIGANDKYEPLCRNCFKNIERGNFRG